MLVIGVRWLVCLVFVWQSGVSHARDYKEKLIKSLEQNRGVSLLNSTRCLSVMAHPFTRHEHAQHMTMEPDSKITNLLCRLLL